MNRLFFEFEQYGPIRKRARWFRYSRSTRCPKSPRMPSIHP